MRRKNNLFGPPVELSNTHILERIMLGCKECEECGQPWHWCAVDRPGCSPQINVCGRIMPIRRAVWLVFKKRFHHANKKRITSKCKNKMCCNPELLIQATPGKILAMQYQNGKRDANAVRQHLLKNIGAWTKVSDEVAAAIRADTRPKSVAAPEYGVAPDYFTRIRRGEARFPRNLGPFAGLIR
jgi:hypothetical protein